MSSLRVRTAFVLLVPAAAALVLAAVTGPAGAAPYASGGVRALPAWTPPPGSTAVPPSATSAPAPPGPVTGLRVTAVAPSSVTLAWDPVAAAGSPVVNYRVTWAHPFADLGGSRDAGLATGATITEDVVPTGQYTAGVTAQDSSGRSSCHAGVHYVRARDAAGNLSIASPTVPSPLAPGGSPSSPPPPAGSCAFAYRTVSS